MRTHHYVRYDIPSVLGTVLFFILQCQRKLFYVNNFSVYRLLRIVNTRRGKVHSNTVTAVYDPVRRILDRHVRDKR